MGPTVTLELPAGFRLEFDALYRRVGYRIVGSDILGESYFQRFRGNSWEFPLIVRRTLRRGLYAGIGYAPRVIHGSGHANGIFYQGYPTRVYREYDLPGAWDTTHGVVAAAGIEKRVGRLRIAPEVRYTYWNKPAVEESGSQGFYLASSQHQVELMVGITFP